METKADSSTSTFREMSTHSAELVIHDNALVSCFRLVRFLFHETVSYYTTTCSISAYHPALQYEPVREKTNNSVPTRSDANGAVQSQKIVKGIVLSV